MNITVTDREQCRKELRLEIPAATVREETDKIAAGLAKTVNVPGFRRGHVPKSVVKTRFRKELRDEMLSHLLPHSFNDAVQEKKLSVIGEPRVEDLKFGDDESIDVTFSLEVAPEFTLSNYKGIALTKREYKVRDEDVERAVEHLQQGQAELAPVEDRPSRAGDVVTANLIGVLEATDEQAAEEIKQDDLAVELGAAGVLKEFSDALTGAQPGDKKEFTVTYPADHKPEKYAGRRVNYSAEVTAVRTKELPEVDDEFARSINEEFKTADELRANIRSKLEQQAAQRTDAEFNNAVIEQLIDRNRFDVPEYMVEKQIDSRMKSLLRELAGRGMDPRTLNVNWEGIRDGHRERAEREVRGSFILERVAENEKIEVSEEELSGEIKQIADSVGQTEEALRARLTKDGRLDSIAEQVRHRKALDLVIASAEIRTEQKEGLGADEAAEGEGGRVDD
ncbi:MAG TPA: trigger factor [Blastocatellia bacterium]|nr:trigger factor [Blastocatellia bacterium]